MAVVVDNETSREPSGCIVVLEPGAKWPERVFAAIPHRDSVVVFNASEAETPDHFLGRLTDQFARLKASGVLLRTVVVACAAAGITQSIDRNRLTMHVQERVHKSADVVFVAPGES